MLRFRTNDAINTSFEKRIKVDRRFVCAISFFARRPGRTGGARLGSVGAGSCVKNDTKDRERHHEDKGPEILSDKNIPTAVGRVIGVDSDRDPCDRELIKFDSQLALAGCAE
jgi:hypothetical protein